MPKMLNLQKNLGKYKSHYLAFIILFLTCYVIVVSPILITLIETVWLKFVITIPSVLILYVFVLISIIQMIPVMKIYDSTNNTKTVITVGENTGTNSFDFNLNPEDEFK